MGKLGSEQKLGFVSDHSPLLGLCPKFSVLFKVTSPLREHLKKLLMDKSTRGGVSGQVQHLDYLKLV